MAETKLAEFSASAFYPAPDDELESGDVFAPLTQVNGRLVAVFDDTDEEAIITPEIQMPSVAGTLKARISFFTASDVDNNIDFEVFVEAKTEGVDTLDMEASSSWDSANAVTAISPAAAGDPGSALVTLSNDDSVAEGDSVRFGLRRDANDGTNDTATGDVYVTKLTIIDET